MSFTNPPTYSRTCRNTVGGIARVFLFDPADFDFTQAAPPTGSTATQAYSAVATATGAGANPKMIPVTFDKKSAEYTFKQTKKNTSSSYEHQLEFKLSDLSQMTTNWNKAVDDISACAGVGIIIQLNSGKLFVFGEGIVNGLPIDIPLEMVQDGSSGTSGKLMDDENAETVIIKGTYPRKMYEFTGGIGSILALAA